MSNVFTVVLVIALGAAAYVWLDAHGHIGSPCVVFLFVLGGLLVLLWWGFTHARLVSLQQEVYAARGALVAQLRQRHDLIPDVLTAAREAVRVQMEELNRILGGIAAYHAAGSAGTPSDPEKPIELALMDAAAAAHRARPLPHPPVGRLDPAVYVELQRAMRATEENVSAARRFVEAAIGQYNAAVRTLPGTLVATFHGFAQIPQAVLTAALDCKPDYFAGS